MQRVSLSPELENFLRILKMKYGVSDVDLAKLIFMLNDWIEKVLREACGGEACEV